MQLSGRNISRQIILGLAAIALVAGCGHKKTQTDDTPAATAGATSTDSVQSAPLSFDPQGSDSGKIDGLETINFGLDKSVLSSDAKSKLRGNVAWMNKNTSAKIQIEGHCDARGSVEYNIALGERRANVVKNYMTSQGVSADRLSTISYGKEKPLVQGDSEAAYAKNRRANFVPLQ